MTTRTPAPHGYGRYTRGCRCGICRKAKADYMRERRHEATRAAAASTDDARSGKAWPEGLRRRWVPGIKHGTFYGYEEKGCRCFECTEAASVKRRDEARRQREREAGQS